MRKIDLKRQLVGRLIPLRSESRHENGKARNYWWCQCVCTRQLWVPADRLLSLFSPQLSCGCFSEERRSKAKYWGTLGYKFWCDLFSLCYLQENQALTMCPQWRSRPDEFIRWFNDEYQGFSGVTPEVARSNCKAPFAPWNCYLKDKNDEF